MTYTFTFEDADMAVLNDALANMPYRLAAPVIAKMNAQTTAAQGQPDPHDHMKRGATPDDQPVNDS